MREDSLPFKKIRWTLKKFTNKTADARDLFKIRQYKRFLKEQRDRLVAKLIGPKKL